MSLLDEVRDDLGTVSAEVLVFNNTTRRWDQSGTTFEAAIQDYSGRETYALGQTLDTELVRMYTDFTAAGALPVDPKARVRVEGKAWQVLGAKRISKTLDEAGIVYDLQRVT